MTKLNVKRLLENLTGQTCPIKSSVPPQVQRLLSSEKGLGYSQLNELLLSFGYDRVSQEFFQYLVDGTVQYSVGEGIVSFEQIKDGLDRFLRIALLRYGNIKFAFKHLSSDPLELEALLESMAPLEESNFSSRHEAIHLIEPIDGTETYYLGYVIEGNLRESLKAEPENELFLKQEARRQELVAQGVRNHEAYLLSDHLDVYVATSMRERHEYALVNRTVSEIFSSPRIADLKLRWFDPTQSYCHDRIDKGLVEALMLKRAKCTIYLAQESDTFGKDSELASTLAQGKPVIAFVPESSDGSAEEFISVLKEVYPGEDEILLLLNQLRTFDPELAWKEKQVRRWLDNPENVVQDKVKNKFVRTLKARYEKRAALLRDVHPLGLQVNLETGVANGVLVVRTAEDCAELVRRVVTRSLEFDFEKKRVGEFTYSLLREKISGCIFRVMTGDPLLTNSFWNFYLRS